MSKELISRCLKNAFKFLFQVYTYEIGCIYNYQSFTINIGMHVLWKASLEAKGCEYYD